MKTIKYCFAGLFLLTLLLFGAGTLFFTTTYPGEYSIFENRRLADAPDTSADAILNGRAGDSLESYLSDHLIGRSVLLKADTMLKKLCLPVSVNEVISSGGVLLNDYGINRQDTSADAADARLIAEDLAAARDAAAEYGGTFLFAGIPAKCEVYRDSYPSVAESHAEILDAKREALSAALAERGVPAVFLNGAFDTVRGSLTDYYSAVDHHYTLKGAFLCWQTVCETLTENGCAAFPVPEEPAFYGLENPMLGTYNRKLYNLTPVREKLLVYQEPDVPFERFDNGVPVESTVFRLPSGTDSYVSYTVYMGGDVAETVIRTNRPELPSILIVGDSFTNALECFAPFSFNEMRSLDYRHYSGMPLTEYIAQYRPDIVLYVRDSSVYTLTDGNGNVNLR